MPPNRQRPKIPMARSARMEYAQYTACRPPPPCLDHYWEPAGEGDRDRAGTRGPVPKGLATNQPPPLSHRARFENIAAGGEPADKNGGPGGWARREHRPPP